MTTFLIYDPIRKDVLELNVTPLLTIYTGRNGNGDWIVRKRSYIEKIQAMNERKAANYFHTHCHELGINYTPLNNQPNESRKA